MKMIKIDFYGFFLVLCRCVSEWKSQKDQGQCKKEKTMTQWLIKEFHLPPRRRVCSPDRAPHDDYQTYPNAGVEGELNSEGHPFYVSFYGGKTSHFFFLSWWASFLFPPNPFCNQKKGRWQKFSTFSMGIFSFFKNAVQFFGRRRRRPFFLLFPFPGLIGAGLINISGHHPGHQTPFFPHPPSSHNFEFLTFERERAASIDR